MDENKFGTRDSRGHLIPNEAAARNPLWMRPINFFNIFKWFIFSYIFSWNLFYFSVALVSW